MTLTATAYKAGSTQTRSSVISLVRLEATRLLKKPVFVVGSCVSGALVFRLSKGSVPVWRREDVEIAVALLPLAAVSLLCTYHAALRSRLDDTEELFTSMPVEARSRIVAHVVLALAGFVVSIAIVAVAAVYLEVRGAVVTPRLGELITGPIIVLGSGTLGVLVARIWPHPVSAPLALVVIGSLQLFVSAGVTDSFGDPPRARWLLPWVAQSTTGDPSPDVMIRPTLWHVTYLIALAILGGATAVLTRGVRWRALIGFVLALAIAASAGAVQLRPITPGERADLVALVAQHERYQTCTNIHDIRYCAYRGYEPLVRRWAAIGSRIVKQLPATTRTLSPLYVRQILDVYGGELPSDLEELLVNRWQEAGDRAAMFYSSPELYVETRWPTGTAVGNYEFVLALGIASWFVELPITIQSLKSGGECSARGQARAVVALWLAATSSNGSAAALRSVLRGSDSDVLSLRETPAIALTGAPVQWGTTEATLAADLAERSLSEVGATIRDHWDELMMPSTPTSRLAELLHLSPDKQLTDTENEVASCS